MFPVFLYLNLTATSSVKLSVKSLIDKSLLLRDEDGNYFVYDRFFFALVGTNLIWIFKVKNIIFAHDFLNR